MIEIIIVFALASWARNQAQKKGHAWGKYVALMIGLWFLGEITGGIIGLVFFYDPSMIYLLALAGAAAGAAIAAKTIRGLEPIEMPAQHVPEVIKPANSNCPRCGQAARPGDRFCRQCGTDLGIE